MLRATRRPPPLTLRWARWRWRLAAAALGAAVCAPVAAAGPPLGVPFLPQTEALCGGAAAAMVMRYWGAADVYPDAFAPLVDRAAGGIRTSALSGDLERRGWTAVAAAGDTAELEKEIGRGRPVIALIEDRPGRYHYVVVLGRSNDRIVVHDPARGPFREIDAARFDAAWSRADRWMLLLLPPPTLTRDHAADSPETPAAPPSRTRPDGDAGSTCAALVDHGVAQAADDRAGARATLARATADCPNEAGAWRELAGLDALDANWTDAAERAGRATALDPHDELGWRILATASYMRHDDLAALAAWNRVGEPQLDLIDIKGLGDMRYAVVADAIGIAPRDVLTPDAIRRAERRVRDLPAVAAARVTFHPVERGRAQIDAAVVERERAPSGYISWIRIGVDALTDRAVTAAFSNPTGGGDVAGVTWRWWEHRPMVSGFYAAPAPARIGGVWRVDASRETQTFGRVPFEETRTRAGLTIGNWLTARTRFTSGVAFERWTDRSNDVALSAGVEHWLAADHVRVQADVTQAIGASSYTTSGVTAAARSTTRSTGFVLFGVAGYRAATLSSPTFVWPGADTGHARDVLLRAHPLLDDGIISDGAFGRRLAFATAEAQRWTALRRLPARVAPAVFVDLARATRGLAFSDTQLHVDAGAGVRVALPAAGVLRADVARGLRDGGTVVSVAWDRRWR